MVIGIDLITNLIIIIFSRFLLSIVYGIFIAINNLRKLKNLMNLEKLQNINSYSNSRFSIINLYYNKIANNKNSEKISVLSFNILAQKYVPKESEKLYSSFDYRIKRIIDDIKILKPDIICLQEVTSGSFKKLNLELNFEYEFIEGNNDCANFNNFTLFKRNKFINLSNSNSLLLKFDRKYIIEGNKGVLKSEFLFDKKKIIVYNVHLPWRPSHDIFKHLIINEIYKDIIFQNYSENNIFILGDFNTLTSSLMIKSLNLNSNFINIFNLRLLRILDYFRKKSNSFKENLKSLKKSNIFEKLINFDNSIFKIENQNNYRFKLAEFCFSLFLIKIKYGMKSSYYYYNKFIDSDQNKIYNKNLITYSDINVERILIEEEKEKDNHPNFTNYTKNFKNCIDYILFSDSNMKLSGLMKLPNFEELKNSITLPNKDYPSDHLPLYCEYLLL